MAASLYKERLNQFDEILIQSEEIDLKKLRKVSFRGGIPDVNHFRSLSWKLLLGYLSPNKSEWSTTLTKKRQIYKQFVEELILTDPSNYKQHDDHPLNPAPTSQWNVYFKDNEILLQIFKDVRRLYPDISFFQQKIAKSTTKSSKQDGNQSQNDEDNQITATESTAPGTESTPATFDPSTDPTPSPTSLTPNHKPTCDIIGRPSNNIANSVDIVRSTFGAIKTKDSSSKNFLIKKSSSSSFNCSSKGIKNSNDFENNYSEDNFDELYACDDNFEYHWQVVARILFIYAKLNPGSGYVQGMNEIIGPIYYVFANDHREEDLKRINKRTDDDDESINNTSNVDTSSYPWSASAESDTFWCFTELMSEIRDMYNSHLDSDRSTGVVAVMTKISNLLSAEDADLYHTLFQVQAIKPHFYAFRWVTLLLSQEFPLPEVLRIWDFLFSDSERFNFLTFISCSMILLLKRDLMANDFSHNMKLLQNFPTDKFDVSSIVTRAKILLHNHSK